MRSTFRQGAEPREMIRNDEVFRAVVIKHGPRLYTHVRSIVLDHDDADDVLQNSFLKAWQNLDGFRREADLSTWLYRIATNEALQHLRKQKLKRLFLGSQNNKPEPIADDSRHDGEAIKRKLEKAMHTLSVQQRMVFGMKYFNDMKYSDISQALGLSEGTLKAVYHNAVKKIEKFIIANTD